MTTIETERGLDVIDTNVVLRYLVPEVPELTARATSLIESDRVLALSIVALAEIGYVLTKVYNVDRSRTVDTLVELLNRENISVLECETDQVVEALLHCRPSGRVSFSDALLWAMVRSTESARFWTFDYRFPTMGIEVRQP